MAEHAYVLVVEDNDLVRTAVTAVLECAELPVQTAEHGRAALERVRQLGVEPRVILLDLSMPVMCGRTFLEHQAAEPLCRDVPVLILTAESDLPARWPATVQAVLRKPLDIEQLLAAVHRLVQRPT